MDTTRAPPPISTTTSNYDSASAASSAPTVRHLDLSTPRANADPFDPTSHSFKEVQHKPQKYSDSRNHIGTPSSYATMAAHAYTMEIPLLGLIAGPKPAYPRGREKGKGGNNNNRGRGGGRGAQHTYGGKGRGKGTPQWDY